MSLEKRLSDVETSIKVIAQYVKEQTAKIEGELGSLKGTEALYDAKPDIEKFSSEIDGLKSRIDSISSAQPPSSYDDATLRKSVAMLRAELNDFRNDVSPKVQYLDKKTDKLRELAESSSDIEEIKKHVEKVDKKVHETLAVKEELDDIEETLTKMKTIANRLKDFDAASYREEFDKHMSQMFGQMRELEEKDIHKVSQLADQLKDMEISDIKNLSEKLKHLEKLETNEAKKLVEMFEQFKDVEMKDLKNFSKQIKEAKEITEEEAVNRMAFEKRILDLEQLVNKFKQLEHSDVKRISEFMQQLKEGELNDIKKIKENFESETKRLNTAFEYIQGIEMEELKEVAGNIKEAKAALEDESINRISNEKRLANMEAKLNKVNDFASHMENVEGLDIEKLSNRINDIESNMKMNTVKLLTQQLNEFAKSMDRRIPNIVSREEYIRQVADLNQRMRTIEAPDLSPLGARVERLEHKIEEVVSMMRQMYNRVPIVVE